MRRIAEEVPASTLYVGSARDVERHVLEINLKNILLFG